MLDCTTGWLDACIIIFIIIIFLGGVRGVKCLSCSIYRHYKVFVNRKDWQVPQKPTQNGVGMKKERTKFHDNVYNTIIVANPQKHNFVAIKILQFSLYNVLLQLQKTEHRWNLTTCVFSPTWCTLNAAADCILRICRCLCTNQGWALRSFPF